MLQESIWTISSHIRCFKGVCIRRFYGPYFPVFGLNTDQKNSEYGHFSRSDTPLPSTYQCPSF